MSALRAEDRADGPRRLRCRIGLHRWVQIKHEDTDLDNPAQEIEWRTACRYCGVEQRAGLGATFALAGIVAVAGALLWWLVSPVLGGLVIMGAVLGLGWTAALTFLGRIGGVGFRYRG